MRAFSLTTYTIRVQNRTETQYLPVANFGAGVDLLEVLTEYLNTLHVDIYHDQENQLLLRVPRFEVKGRTVSGLLEKGEYGIESELLNVHDESTSYERTIDDAEMLPYYFLVVVPIDADEAVMNFQKSGLSGIKSVFTYDFGGYFSDVHPDFRIQINRLVPRQLLDRFFGRGRVIKIRLVRYGIPSDITDLINTGHTEEEGSLELQIRAKRGRALEIKERVQEILEGRRDLQSFIELRDFEYDNVKIELEIGGRYRTIDLRNPDNLRSHYDISNMISTHGGHPEYASIDDVSRGLMGEILDGMGLEAGGV
jgi:hypothetical protein